MADTDQDNNPANEREALEEAGYDTSDVGRGNKAFNAGTVAEETGTTSKEAARAGHQARDDMAAAGDMDIPGDRHGAGSSPGADKTGEEDVSESMDGDGDGNGGAE